MSDIPCYDPDEWFTEQLSKRPLRIANTDKLLKEEYGNEVGFGFLPCTRLRDINFLERTLQ